MCSVVFIVVTCVFSSIIFVAFVVNFSLVSNPKGEKRIVYLVVFLDNRKHFYPIRGVSIVEIS